MKIFRHKPESICRHCTVGPMEMHFTCPKGFKKTIKDTVFKKPGKKALSNKEAILQKMKLCLKSRNREDYKF